MSEFLLSPAPNWFSPQSLAADAEGRLLVFCANTVLVAALIDRRDAPALRVRVTLPQAHQQRINAVTIYRRTDELVFLVTGGDDGAVKLWSCSTPLGDARWTIDACKQHSVHGETRVVAVDQSTLRPTLAVSVDQTGSLVVWDTIAHSTRHLHLLPRIAATALRCSPHTELLAAIAGKRSALYTVSLAAGGRVLQRFLGHDDDVTSISWCPAVTDWLSFPQDFLLASVAKDNTLRVWGTRSGRCHVVQCVQSGSRRAVSPADRNWLCVTWPRADHIYCGTGAGSVVRWTLGGEDAAEQQTLHSRHGRAVSSVCVINGDSAGNSWMVSCAADRQLVECRLATDGQLLEGGDNAAAGDVHAHSTLGGYCYCLHGSPVDAGRVAVGCGDNVIRVFNLSSDRAATDCTAVWNGIKAKVTTLAWHPDRDNRLAFGTDQGRVGVCDPSAPNKPPHVCPDTHRGPLLCVVWHVTGSLYSLSASGALWRHGVEPALKPSVWPPADCTPAVDGIDTAYTRLAWQAGGDVAALGRADGTVEFRDASGRWQGNGMGPRRAVSALQWHPPLDADWSGVLAAGTAAAQIALFRVTAAAMSSAVALQPYLLLSGHHGGVLDLAWSVHKAGLLVSCGMDRTARVWDAESGRSLAVFWDHGRAVRCCLPHPLQRDLVLSGAEDHCLRVWDLTRIDSVQPPRPEPSTISADHQDLPKKKKKSKTSKIVVQHQSADDSQSSALASSGASKPPSDQPRELVDGRRPRGQKCLFPVCVALENRGKSFSQSDIQQLLHLLPSRGADGPTAGRVEASGNQQEECRRSHLGLFQGESALELLVSAEVEHHLTSGNQVQATQLTVYSGDISQTLRQAATQARLTDHMMALAPMVSYRFWEEMCVMYAKQLEDINDIVKASSFLVACHKVERALEVLLRHRLYREALVLCRLRCPGDSVRRTQILQSWAEQMITDGNLEQAAKCLISCGDLGRASVVLARRSDLASLRLAGRVAALAGDVPRARALCLQCVHDSCLRRDWTEGLMAGRSLPALKAAVFLCVAHRTLIAALTAAGPLLRRWTLRMLLPGDVTAATLMDDVIAVGPSDDVTVVGPPDDVTVVGPPDDVTVVVPPDDVTVVGPPDNVTVVGPPDDVTVVGPPDDVTAARPSGDVTAAGASGDLTAAELSGDVTAAGSSDDVTAIRSMSDVTAAASPFSDVTEEFAAGLLESIRTAWSRELTDGEAVPELLDDVAYLTVPSDSKQVWLSVACDLYRAVMSLSAGDSDGCTEHTLSALQKCHRCDHDNLPQLTSLLVASTKDALWSADRQLVVSALVTVLHSHAPSRRETDTGVNGTSAELTAGAVNGEAFPDVGQNGSDPVADIGVQSNQLKTNEAPPNQLAESGFGGTTCKDGAVGQEFMGNKDVTGEFSTWKLQFAEQWSRCVARVRHLSADTVHPDTLAELIERATL